MLRAVRFAARFGYTSIRKTLLRSSSWRRKFTRSAASAFATNSRRCSPKAMRAAPFELLDESGLLHEVLPEIEKMKGVEQPPQYHPEGDVLIHTLLLLENLPASLHALWPGERCCTTWASRQRSASRPTVSASTDMSTSASHGRSEICASTAHVERGHRADPRTRRQSHEFADTLKMKESTLKRFIRLPKFDEHLALHRADCLASHANLELYDFANKSWRKRRRKRFARSR